MTQITTEQDHYRRILNWEMSQTRRYGQWRLGRYMENRLYYYGQNEQADDIRQPLGIRYVPILAQKHVHYLFGEWEEDIVGWRVTPWLTTDQKDPSWDTANKIERAIIHLMRRSNANEILHRGALNGSIYGDTVFKVSWDQTERQARIESILPEYYHAIAHPLNPGQTLEAVIAFNLDRATAYSMYKSPGSPGFLPVNSGLNPALATVWEWWGPFQTIVAVDDQLVLNKPNIYMGGSEEFPEPGLLPFVHIPNLAVDGEYYGFGDAEPVFALADELNYRLADFGDIINYHAHPITILTNFFGDAEELPVAADAVWRLGREAEAKYLEWSGAPPEVLQYIELLMRIMLETTSLTMVAFGRIEQSQASSAALNIQMLPITEVVRRKRAVWTSRLRDLAIKLMTLEHLSLDLLKAQGLTDKSFEELYEFKLEDLKHFEIKPKWAPIIPRDRLAVVNEQVALITNKARSILTALNQLGTDDPLLERDRIMQDLRDILEVEAKVNMKIADHDAKLEQEAQKLAMEQAEAEHQMALEADPTTDPERHARNLELIKTQGSEERKTMQTKAQTTERIARTKTKRVSAQVGGKNSTKAKGGSNTDGGE